MEPWLQSVMMHDPQYLLANLRLVGIRGFRDLEVDLRDESGQPRKRLLIIGQNGTCKTTLLRAIALGLCDNSDADALVQLSLGGFVCHGMASARIEVGLTDPKGIEAESRDLWLRKSREKELVDSSKSGRITGWVESPWRDLFACGYGAGRYGVAGESGREYRIFDSVYTLFDYRRPLLDPELTLRRLEDFLGSRRYEATLRGIKRVLNLDDEDQIRFVSGGGVELTGPSAKSPVRLEGWADGYRMTFSWMLDLYGWAMRAKRIDEDGQVHGIVLVDELDQHLHPALQSRVLGHLAEVLPHVQLIATTHSPLVALGAKSEELLVLRRDGTQVARVEQLPDFSLYSAEDMLEDERLFDTLPYSPETAGRLRRYNRLVAIPKDQRTRFENEELTRLARELRSQQLIPADDSEVAAELRSLLVKHGL